MHPAITKPTKTIGPFQYHLSINSFLFFLIFIFFSPFPILSQKVYKAGGLRFEHFQTQDGLPTNNFGRFLQDSKGVIWLGTVEGLVWYDGYDFLPFSPEGEAASKIKEANVSALFEDSQGFIWIGTMNLGAFRYDPRFNQLEHFLSHNKKLVVTDIKEDASGSICITTWNGFYRIIFPSKTYPDSFKVLPYLPKTLPVEVYRLADSLQQIGRRIASLTFEKDESLYHKKFTISQHVTALVLAVGFRRRSKSSEFIHEVNIKDQNNDIFWSMSLADTYDAADYGPSRIQAAVIDFPPGEYQLSFHYDKAGNLEVPASLFPYLGLQVYKLTAEEDKNIRTILASNSPKSSIFEHYQDVIHTDAEGITWIGGDGGLTKMEIPNPLIPEKVKFTSILNSPNHFGGINSAHVHSIIKSHQGDGFWIGGNAFDEKTGEWGKIVLEYFDKEKTIFTEYKHGIKEYQDLFTLKEWHNGELWIGTWSGKTQNTGVYIIEPPLIKTEDQRLPGTTYLSFNPDEIYSNSEGISFIREDFSGSTWIGTSRKGLFKYNPQNNIFKELDLNPGNIPGTVYPLCFLQDQQGQLWIGTNGHGLYIYDLATHRIKRHIKPNDGSSILSSNAVTRLVEDGQGNIWLAADGVLLQYQAQSNQFFSYPIPIDPYDTQAHKKKINIRDIAIGVGNFLWITTNNGLHRFNTNTKVYEKHYFHLNDKINVWSSSPGSILPQQNGNLLIAFYQGTLSNISFDSLGKYQIRPLLNHHKSFHHLSQDKFGKIWGSSDQGLYELNQQGDTIRIYTEKDGLPIQKIRFILPVADKELWLLTFKGLSRFDLINRSFTNYLDKSDQLLSSVLSGRLALLRDGQIVCSRRGGFYLFDPPQLQPNHIPPKVILTDLLISNQEIKPSSTSILEKTIRHTKHIALKYEQNDLTFKFTGLHFNQPEKNTYKFQLKGYDKQWINAQTQRLATYTNLPPGKYTFSVIAANSDSIFSDEKDAQINITIYSPWWRTWWAVSFYFIIGLGFFATIRWFELSRRLAKAEAQKQEELNQLRTKLYTNITHEFRTPLTIILGMASQLKSQVSEHAKENLQLIKRNGQQLLKLVNQMLDLSKLESGLLKLELEQSDIINYLQYLTESFKSYAESKNIQLIFRSERTELYMDYDPIRLLHIVSNLLSNAIKFTPAGGEVYLITSFNTLGVLKTPRVLKLTVKDTGIGIPESKIPYIFDRFYQVDDSITRKGEGTGIGLTLTKELVQLMGGQIRVSSELGVGSQFSVILPITRNQVIKMPPKLATINSEVHTPSIQQPNPLSTEKADNPILLIVEDNPDLVKYLLTSFSQNYNLEIALNGQQGIDKALSIIPDIIITDVMMPEKDGFELCATLKNHKLTSHIPIIMLTAKVDVASRLVGLKRGADAYLGKPFLEEELQVQIKVLIDQRKKLQTYYMAQSGLSQEQHSALPTKEEAALENAFLANVNQIITSNLSNHQFSVEQLCKEMFVDPSNLYRKLKALTGVNPSQYIRSHRLAKAKKLLKNTSNTITYIAIEAGFKNQNYFSRLFKKELGMTPSEYRNS